MNACKTGKIHGWAKIDRSDRIILKKDYIKKTYDDYSMRIELLDEGIITEEEFARKKKELLGL